MSVVIIIGSTDLVGFEAAFFFAHPRFDVVDADNDMRRAFFGDEASTLWQRGNLERRLGKVYRHVDTDVGDSESIDALFKEYGKAVQLVIDSAAQPTHDWAARDPITDFTVNANGTLNMLEATRRHSESDVFLFGSTNKVF